MSSNRIKLILRILSIVLILSLAFVESYRVFLLNPTLSKRKMLAQQLSELLKKNSKLKEENKRLKQRLNALINNPFYLEILARTQLGLIKPNEVIYQISEDDKKQEKTP
jgi:cell division protein FtsB